MNGGYDPGPWWWRLRCRLADRLLAWGSSIEPKDRGSVHYVDGDTIVFLQSRRQL